MNPNITSQLRGRKKGNRMEFNTMVRIVNKRVNKMDFNRMVVRRVNRNGVVDSTIAGLPAEIL